MSLSLVPADPKQSQQVRDDRGPAMTEILHEPSQMAPQRTADPIVSSPPAILVPTRRLGVGKRALDLAIAIPAAIITLPIVLLLAAISFAI